MNADGEVIGHAEPHDSHTSEHLSIAQMKAGTTPFTDFYGEADVQIPWVSEGARLVSLTGPTHTARYLR